MILINSIDGDISTTDVMRWLAHFKTPVIRLGNNDRVTSVTITDDFTFSIEINNQLSVRSNEIKSYWYRRGQLDLSRSANKKKSRQPELHRQAAKYTETDASILLGFLYDKLAGTKKIGRIENCTYVNKLIILNKAASFGLAIPPTLVTSSKKELLNFLAIYKEIITKPVAESFYYYSGNYWLPTYTQPVTVAMAKKLPARFGASLFQQKINKKVEIRAFYLNGSYSSMAIFSQNDKKTATDFRNYNYKKPNRTVPYKLPSTIEEKLTQLMNHLSYESGSIDIILDQAGIYYFLEINPVGQFGYLSQQCNYKIEKKIAEYLSA